MEASALQAPATLPRTRVTVTGPLLRFRSDEQLVAMFRAGHDEAFRAIHERYHKRLFAYARQMLPGRQDAEDALQDVFVRAYAGLRASDHELALRAWLFRVAHNRCVDELRRPGPPPLEVLELVRSNVHDPLVEVELRESLRRLIEDIRRLPEQQRSALLMRELCGMTYAELSSTLGISLGAVKSLLVRARVALAQAAEARDTSCILIHEQLVEAHDRGIRPNATARKHIRDCVGCKSFRRELRGISRQLAAFSPTVGPLAILAKTLGFSGGAGGGAAGGGGLALLGGGGATASAGGIAVGVNHLATLLVAAVATAGGAAAIQHTIIAPAAHPAHARPLVTHRHHQASGPTTAVAQPNAIQAIAGVVNATVVAAPKLAAIAAPPTSAPAKHAAHHKVTAGGAGLTPVTGASTVSDPSATGTDGSSTDGTAGTSGSTAAGASTCSARLATNPATAATSPSTTVTSTPTVTPTAPTSTSTCVLNAPASPGTPASAGTATSSATGSSSGSASTGSAPASGSGAESSSTSTASTGGSSSSTK